MKILKFLLLIINIVFSQSTDIETNSIKLVADKFWGVDKYNSIYYSVNNTIYKKTDDSLINFQDFEAGEINSINVFNPLKIGVFYKNTNRFYQLDNKLNSVNKLNFLKTEDLKTITFATLTYRDNVWIFNENTTCLELFSIRDNKSLFKTIPINDNVLDICSTVNNCWVLTSKHILKYNYLGQLEFKINNSDFTKIGTSSKFVILQKENKLYKLELNSLTEVVLPIKNIENFSVNEEYLYIYNSNNLHKIRI